MSYINNDLKNNEKYYKKYLKYKNKYHDTAIKQGGSFPLLSSYLPSALTFGTGALSGAAAGYLINKRLSKKSIEETEPNIKTNDEYISLYLPIESAEELILKVQKFPNNIYKISKSDMLTLINGNYSLTQEPANLFKIVFNKISKDHLQIFNINNTNITAITKENLSTLINQSNTNRQYK